MIKQLLRALIDNSIKFTASNLIYRGKCLKKPCNQTDYFACNRMDVISNNEIRHVPI